MKMFASTLYVVFLATFLVFFKAGVPAESAVHDSNFVQRDGVWYQRDAAGHEWKICPGRMVVRFDLGASEVAKSAALVRQGFSSTALMPLPGGVYLCTYDSGIAPPNALDAIRSESVIAGAYVDTFVEFFGDPYYSYQWSLRKARVDKAWAVTAGSDEVVVAVLDRGYELGHEDLADAIWTNVAEANGTSGVDDDGNGYVDDLHGWDFIAGDNDPSPATAGDEHGTAVAGIACAVRNNNLGVAGIAGGDDGGGAWLLPLRTHPATNVAAGIDYAWRLGVDIINMSFGTGDPGGTIAAAIDSADAHGVLLFAATGNIGVEIIGFPASDPAVIAVGSTDPDDVRICWSNYGSALDIVAPSASGGCPDSLVWTTDNDSSSYSYNPGYSGCGGCSAVPAGNGRYFGAWGGTSAACPFAAGVAALIKAHMPDLSAAEIRERLLASAIDLGDPGFDVEYGNGRVDAYRALTEWGTIATNTTWSPGDTHNGVRYISGDLTVAAGATLTILPGTVIRVAREDDLADGADTVRVEINVEGTLIADGTAANPIVFESWAQASNEDWVGFYFDNQSNGAVFDHCEISGAEYAIESYVPLTLKNSVIEGCRYAGVVSQASGALVQGCTFTDPGSFGIFLVQGSSVVRNTVVDNAVSAALHVQPNAAATVRNSQFLNSDKGIYVGGNFPLSVDSSCVLTGNRIGIHCYNTGTTPTIKRSTVNSNNDGILCDYFSSPLVDANTLRYNGYAITCTNVSSPTIKNNAIKSNTSGVRSATGSAPDIGTSFSTGNNTIAYSTSYHVLNWDETLTVLAQNNCWAQSAAPCGPKASKLLGYVDTGDPICCTVSQQTSSAPPTDLVESSDRTHLVAIVPNPFNPTTTVHYALASQSRVQVRVYDVAGRLVRELVNGTQVAGTHEALWDGADRLGNPASSGIYFVKMEAGRDVFTRKMVLLK